MRWRILALLFLARIGLGFQFQTLPSTGDNLVAAFGFNYVDIGFLIGSFMLPGLVLALPAGTSGRYVSDRVLSVVGLAALAAGGVVSGLASEGGTIGLGRLLSGAGFVLSTVYFTKMVADWFEGREIATAMSILVMSWPFGIAMGQVGHAWLAEAYGWRVPFWIASGYCAVAALGILALYRPAHELPLVRTGPSATLSGREWQLILCAGAAWGLFNAAYVIYLTFGPKTLVSHGLPALTAASVVSLGSWLMILSGAVCGHLVDRYGRRNTILTICMSGAVAALLMLGMPGAEIPASLLFGLIGMAPAGVIIALAGQAVRPERRAFGMGVFFTVYYAAMTASPPVAGAIFEATGDPQGPLVFAMVLFAAVLPATVLFRRGQMRGLVGAAREEA